MAERDRQVEAEPETTLDEDFTDLDDDFGVDVPRDSTADRNADASTGNRLRSRIRERAGSVFSARSFAVSLVLTIGSVVFLGGLLPLGTIGDMFSILFAGFLYGIVTESGRYAELGLAGATVGGGSALLGNLVLSLLGPGVPLILFGVVGGGIAGVLGHYFGRDLQDGLTREI